MENRVRTHASRRVVASYADYVGARRAVDYLAERRFPVERVAIVGSGLRFVEEVTGRLTLWRAASRDAATGAVVGLLFGFVFGFFGLADPVVGGIWLAFWGVVVGAAAGALIALVGAAWRGSRRDFDSIAAFRADRYEILADVEIAERAEALLSELGDSSDGSGGA